MNQGQITVSSGGSWSKVWMVTPKSINLPFIMLYTSPCMFTYYLSFQACWMNGRLATLNTCSFTFIYTSNLAFSSIVVKFSKDFACLKLILLSFESQASKGPWLNFVTAALTPPQPQWPATIISLTFKTSTAYWITATADMSEGETMLATFLRIKIYPQSSPKIQLAFSRESEHPIQRY